MDGAARRRGRKRLVAGLTVAAAIGSGLVGGALAGVAGSAVRGRMATTSGRVVGIDAPVLAAAAAPLPPRLPVSRNPARSIPPSVRFVASCWGAARSVPACNAAALQSINAARASEGYGPLALPAGFYSMSITSQVIATANGERTARGLPAMRENSMLDYLARIGALRRVDPTGPAHYGWGSNLAIGYPTPLAADFGWMYDDGLYSPNVDCRTPSSSGCWGHRRNILSPWGGAAGAGAYSSPWGLVLTQLFVARYP